MRFSEVDLGDLGSNERVKFRLGLELLGKEIAGAHHKLDEGKDGLVVLGLRRSLFVLVYLLEHTSERLLPLAVRL